MRSTFVLTRPKPAELSVKLGQKNRAAFLIGGLIEAGGFSWLAGGEPGADSPMNSREE